MDNSFNATIVWSPANGANLHKFIFEGKDSAHYSGYLKIYTTYFVNILLTMIFFHDVVDVCYYF